MTAHRFVIPRTTALCILALLSAQAHAQSARSGGGGNAVLMQQMQQLASERTTLQADNAKLKKDLDDTRKERDALKNAQQGAQRARVEATQAALKQGLAGKQAAEQELAVTKEKTAQLVAKFRETLQQMREIEAQSTTARQTLASREVELKKCVERNGALYQLNQDILTELDRQSGWSRVARAEPFTRIKRSQLENLVDGYKDRAAQQQIDSGQTPTSPAPH